MKRRVWLTLGLLPAAATWAASSDADAGGLARLGARLSDAPVQRGRFEQRKGIKGFRQPLVSRGDFLMVRDKGVVWQTREPFASTLLLTRDRLRMQDASGQTTSLASGQEPAVRLLNQWLPAILSGDLGALGQAFTVEQPAATAGPWRLQLSPRDAALAQWLQGVELEGDQQLTLLRWRERSGDSIEIRFSQWSSARQASPEELKRLD